MLIIINYKKLYLVLGKINYNSFKIYILKKNILFLILLIVFLVNN